MSLDDLKELKERIKAIPITEVIGSYITLYKKGASHVGLCPFHNDSSPSLQVNNGKQMFMCFVDNIGGDAINFVQRYKNLEFIEAIKDICSVMGIPYEEYLQPKNEPENVKMAKRILSKAVLIYEKIASDPENSEFKKFTESRGLDAETVKDFRIGFAPKTSLISSYLQSIKNKTDREFAVKTALEIGLIQKDKYDPKKNYDTFRERIMFPIFGHSGNPAGFSGRKIFEVQKAKYINSRQSFIFNKSNILFGLNQAKSHIRQQGSVILAEGQMDVIALHKNGIRNSVAVMGVGLSEKNIEILKGITKNFYLGLDSDDAGLTAMERINGLCLKMGIIPKLLKFAPYKDPDEYLTEKSYSEFMNLIKDAPSVLDMLVQKQIPKDLPNSSEEKLQILSKIFEIIAPLGKSINATERILDYSSTLNLQSTPEQITNFYFNYLSSKGKSFQKAKDRPNNQEPQISAKIDNLTPIKKEKNSVKSFEKTIVEEFIKHPECLLHEKCDQFFEFIENPEIKEYICKLKEFIYEIDESEYVNLVGKVLNSEEFSLEVREIVNAALYKYEFSELDEIITERFLKDLEVKIKKKKLIEKKREYKGLQSKCSTTEEADEVIRKIMIIDQEINSLNKQ